MNRLCSSGDLNILGTQWDQKRATRSAIDQPAYACHVHPDARDTNREQRPELHRKFAPEHAPGSRQILDGNINDEAVAISNGASAADSDASCALDRGVRFRGHGHLILHRRYQMEKSGGTSSRALVRGYMG